MTILPLRKSGIWGMPGGGGDDGEGSPPNGCSVPLASTFLWRCGSTHAYRGPIRMCVFKFIPQGKEAPVPTEREDGWAPVRGPEASRIHRSCRESGLRKQRQHIRQSRRHNSVL